MDPRGKKISAEEFRAIKIERDEFHGDQAGEAERRAEVDRTAGRRPAHAVAVRHAAGAKPRDDGHRQCALAPGQRMDRDAAQADHEIGAIVEPSAIGAGRRVG